MKMQKRSAEWVRSLFWFDQAHAVSPSCWNPEETTADDLAEKAYSIQSYAAAEYQFCPLLSFSEGAMAL